MSKYKRNQIEEATSGVLEPWSERPTTELRTRLKRLLDTDRTLSRSPHLAEAGAVKYAFYSADAPGSGVEVWFSGYEAFAILTGLRLLGHGWTQGFAVSIMRRLRPLLEKEHARILKKDPKLLFDEEEIRRRARPGDMAFDVTDPVLLTLVSKIGTKPSDQTEPFAYAICRGPAEAMNFVRKEGSGAATMFELVSVAHRLAALLTESEPNPRGKGAARPHRQARSRQRKH